MKKLLKLLLLLITGVLIIVAVVTIVNRPQRTFGERINFPIDTNAIRHLSEAVQIKTVSYDYSGLDTMPFNELHRFLFSTYPLCTSRLNPQVINGGSLLYHWKTSSASKAPVILYAHMDVVPADSSWKVPAFSGMYDDKMIYGRGVIDDKGGVIGLLESVEKLLSENFSPSRDIYLAFGHDEEKSGREGAKKIAEYLQKLGVKAEFMLDEGGLIAEGMVPFVDRPVAMIATAEKGYIAVELSIKTDGGHSSMPSSNSPVEQIAEAIKKIHDHPSERKILPPLNAFFSSVGPHMRFPFNAIFLNKWLFRPIILNEYEKIPGANAMIRTTAVTTLINGGQKENAIPQSVKAVVNFRLLPGESSETVFDRVKELVANKNIAIKIIGEIDEPSDFSEINSGGYSLIEKSIWKVFPDVIVTPTLSVGGTDSKHFRNVTNNIYRFLPVRMNDKILAGMHGVDEQLEVRSFMESMEFYKELMRSL